MNEIVRHNYFEDDPGDPSPVSALRAMITAARQDAPGVAGSMEDMLHCGHESDSGTAALWAMRQEGIISVSVTANTPEPPVEFHLDIVKTLSPKRFGISLTQEFWAQRGVGESGYIQNPNEILPDEQIALDALLQEVKGDKGWTNGSR